MARPPFCEAILNRFSIFLLGLTALLPACAPVVVPAPPSTFSANAEQRAPVTVLVSIDGFRSDYLQRGRTPVLSRLAADGVTASMLPSFPSKTFPNHWTAVTGYYPDHHGITANSFTDPARPEPKDRFTMATTDPFFWGDKEPIWVTAEKAGIRSGVMFWPGSAVAVGGTLVPRGYGRVDGGVRPADWQAFDQNVTPDQRVNAVIDWLRRPADIRPKLVLLYFDEVDTAGHAAGPNSPELNQALANVDADIARLLDGLAALHQPANIVIIADHGMAETRGSRTIALDKLLPIDTYVIEETGPYATLTPAAGRADAVEAALLKPHANMDCWRKSEIPARFHYGTNPRIPPYICLAKPGWLILPTAATDDRVGGSHGYDNRAPDMAALFVANGPAFKQGATLPPFENIAIAPLLRRLLGLPQDRSLDGSIVPIEGAFAN